MIILSTINSSDLATLRQEMRLVFATKEDSARIELKIVESKTDMIKWVFAFFITLAVMMAGLYFKK